MGRGVPARERVVTLCGERMPHSGHVCAFFDSNAQKYDIIAPFFRDAIDSGDRVINVVDAARRDTHIKTLKRAHVPVASAIASDQLRLFTSEETYMRDGVETLQGMLDLLREALEEAEREGRGVRTCGEMNWITRSRMPVEEVLEYEARVNEFVPTFACTLLCVYDLATTPSVLISDILATHPYAIINGRLRPNPYVVSPTAYLEMLRARKPGAPRAE